MKTFQTTEYTKDLSEYYPQTRIDTNVIVPRSSKNHADKPTMQYPFHVPSTNIFWARAPCPAQYVHNVHIALILPILRPVEGIPRAYHQKPYMRPLATSQQLICIMCMYAGGACRIVWPICIRCVVLNSAKLNEHLNLIMKWTFKQ